MEQLTHDLFAKPFPLAEQRHHRAAPAQHRKSRQLNRAASFDELVGAGECQWRNREAERRGGLEIDHQLEPGRPQEGQVGRLFTLENPGRVDPNLAVNFVNDWPLARQSARIDKLTPGINRGQRVSRGQRDESIALTCKERIGADEERTGSLLD